MKKAMSLSFWTLFLSTQLVGIASKCYNEFRYNEFYNYYMEYTDCKFFDIHHPELFSIRTTAPYSVIRFSEIIFDHCTIPKLTKNTFIVEVKEVTKLAITNSRLTDIEPDGLLAFPKLTKLIFSHNGLTEVKPVFRAQTRLSELSLSHNNISKMHADAIKNAPLKLLDLSFNSLSSLDSINVHGRSVFGLLKSLENLDLSNNKLMILDNWAFSNNSNLQYLNLSFNPIIILNSEVFDGLNNLVFLNLSRNAIGILDPEFSIGLKSLRTFDLSNNRLNILNPNAFQYTPKLENLYLHNNLLYNISVISLKLFTNLSSISIHGNPMECSVIFEIFDQLHNISVDSDTENYILDRTCDSSTTETTLETTETTLETTETTLESETYTEPTTLLPRKETAKEFEELRTAFNDFVRNQTDTFEIVVKLLGEINAKPSVEYKNETENILVETLKEINVKLKKQFVGDFEELNSTFNDFVKNQKDKLEDLMKLSEEIIGKTFENKNEDMLMDTIKEINLKLKPESATEMFEVARNLSASVSDLQNILMHFMRNETSKDSISEDVRNVLINFAKENAARNVCDAIFRTIMSLLLLLVIYLQYKLLSLNSKTPSECKEMQPVSLTTSEVLNTAT